MGSVYKRGPFWWIAFKVPNGKRVLRSTGISSSQPEREARAVLLQVERELESGARRDANAATTVAEYAAQWTEARKARKLMNATRDLKRLRRHAFPVFGAKRLGVVAPREVRAWVLSLRAAGWAPRTVRNLYGLLHRLFADAVADELIIASPAVLKKGDLPKKKDKDPKWRSSAKYKREEVDALLSHGGVPADRRATYALAALTGMREGEISALRWNAIDYDS
ncbi:MAG: hypothetical protein JNM17_06740, partial [Archangium sp.]|nr:hypothetical protein [Archangium sp.]